MSVELTINVKASCDVCGKKFELLKPDISGKLNDRTEKPINFVFNSQLGMYTVMIFVANGETCFVVEEDKVLCEKCHKDYRIALGNIELETIRSKLAIIDNLKATKK